jgi:hypothetical protein
MNPKESIKKSSSSYSNRYFKGLHKKISKLVRKICPKNQTKFSKFFRPNCPKKSGKSFESVSKTIKKSFKDIQKNCF